MITYFFGREVKWSEEENQPESLTQPKNLTQKGGDMCLFSMA